ncbi:MAG: hypothetical protein LBJ88_02395 [Campylobacteraceae bacterium]|jgi:hypothetical protein|nr:hypothetical protein [Campylobacteraceae bacterium]
MKHISSVISHIRRYPSLEKLEQIASYKKLLSLLPISYQNAVKFMYNKNDTLFFVLKHPAFKMEFNYKITLIKGLLKELVKQDKSCECINANNIKAFVTNKISLHVEEQKTDTVPLYDEKSKGDFKNLAKNAELNKLFESIRDIIAKKSERVEF